MYDQFLAKIEEIYNEHPTYQLGHDGSDGKCDCIGLIRGALNRCGIKAANLRGTNQAARKAIDELKEIHRASDLERGMVVLKVRAADDPDYPLPARYRPGGADYNGDLNNYTHIGVVSSTAPLTITHMTSPTTTKDHKLGRWSYAGYLHALGKPGGSEEGKTMTAIAYAENGLPINMRKQPRINSQIECKVPCGAEVEAQETSDEWVPVRYEGKSGYIRAEFLRSDAPPDPASDTLIQISLTRAQAEALVQITDQIIKVIGRG